LKATKSPPLGNTQAHVCWSNPERLNSCTSVKFFWLFIFMNDFAGVISL